MSTHLPVSNIRYIIREAISENTLPPEVQVFRDYLRERHDEGEFPEVDSKEWVTLLALQFTSSDPRVVEMATECWDNLPSAMAIVESKFMPTDDARWLAMAVKILELVIDKSQTLNDQPPSPEEVLDPPDESELEAVQRAVSYTESWLTGGAPGTAINRLSRLLRYYIDYNINDEELGRAKPAVRLAEEIVEFTWSGGQDEWHVAHHAIWDAMEVGANDAEIAEVVRGFNPNTSLDEDEP